GGHVNHGRTELQRMPIGILSSGSEQLNFDGCSLSREQPQLNASFLARPTATSQMLFEGVDVVGRNEVCERSADQFVGIVAQQLAAANIDFFDETVFVEARITDR